MSEVNDILDELTDEQKAELLAALAADVAGGDEPTEADKFLAGLTATTKREKRAALEEMDAEEQKRAFLGIDNLEKKQEQREKALAVEEDESEPETPAEHYRKYLAGGSD